MAYNDDERTRDPVQYWPPEGSKIMAAWRLMYGTLEERFPPRLREKYLTKLAELGQPVLAAYEAGVRLSVVQEYSELEGPEPEQFVADCEWAKQVYSASLVHKLESDAVCGATEPIMASDGSVAGYKTKYETSLRVRVLVKHDRSYGMNGDDEDDGSKKAQTGVLMVPMPQASVDDWAKTVASVSRQRQDGRHENK